MPTIAKLLFPPTLLSGTVFGAFFRDTRGVALADADRMNHFPASPMVAVTLVLKGAIFILPEGKDWRAANDTTPLPKLSAMGPQDGPITSWSPDECAAVTVGFYFDAWIALDGDAKGTKVPEAIANAMLCFTDCEDPDSGWTTFCQALDTQIKTTSSAAWSGLPGVGSWAKAVATRAALSSTGRTIRSMQRRLKRTSGQTQRTLDFYAAFENLHRISVQHPDTAPAEIALDAGYADQSHMGRVVRRATGFSPARLNHAIETEEAFWCYRLLGERF